MLARIIGEGENIMTGKQYDLQQSWKWQRDTKYESCWWWRSWNQEGFYYDSDDVTWLYVAATEYRWGKGFSSVQPMSRRLNRRLNNKSGWVITRDTPRGIWITCTICQATLFVTHPAKNVDSGTCASNYSLVDNTARLQKLLRTLRGIYSGLRKIKSFKQAPAPPGGLSLILQYFNILLGKGELNHFESWRARCCNREGNGCLRSGLRRTCVYPRANVPDKVIACFAETGQTEKIVLYSKKVGCKGAEFASQLVNDENRPLVDMERVVDIFMSQNMVQPTTSSLLDALKDNKPEQGHLWTRLLEINLIHVPQVADAIVSNEMFTNYDRPRIANLYKTAGLLQRALEHYEDLADIKHAIVHTSGLQLEEMLRVNIRQNLQAVIQIATKYTDVFGPVKLIEMFGSFKTFEGGANLQREQLLQPEKVKNFLKEAKLPDQVPLILVCDRFDFVHDLVLYMYQNGLTKFIEILLNVGCDETTIKGLLASVTENFPIDECVNEAEQRNHLKHILPWLEARMQSGSQDPAVPNALAKIFINSNNNLKTSLKENNLYESLVVGKFCEARDQRQFDVQAVPHETALIDQCTDPDAVSVTVKAFLSADFPIELIELLEKVVIEPFPISDNIQNLLLLTSIRADKGKVVGYINNLQNYDAREIAKIATYHGLYEEALTIYKKYDQHAMAINVLVEHITPIDHSLDYLNKANKPDSVWSRLANAQLDGLRIKDAVDSYIKAEDPSNFAEVIEIWSHAGKHDDLVRFLQMAPKALREPKIDTELAYAYAKTDRLHDMEAFLTMSDIADILEVGEKCFEDELYQAAKLLFTSISNWARLATTLIYLGKNQAAVESAWKAGNTQAWKQVHAARIEKAEFRLAQICVLNIVVHTGYCDEVPSLLEAALSLERAHLFISRINIPKAGVMRTILVIKATEKAHLWPELGFLYIKYDEFLFQDNAASAMIECSADAWEHNQFKDVVVRATNVEIYYEALTFYLQEQLTLLTDFLTVLIPCIEHAQVVHVFCQIETQSDKFLLPALEHPYVFHAIAHVPREVIVMETIPAVGGTLEVLGLSGGSEGGTKATGAKKGKNKKLESQNYASKARSVEQTYQGPARWLSHQGCHWLAEVIEISSHAGKHDDLVCFLRMINTELAYAYAKTVRLHDMEDFLAMTNVADILEVGEKCFTRTNYTRLPDYCSLVSLTGPSFKASNFNRLYLNVWKQIYAACVEKAQLKLAHLNIVVYTEEVAALLWSCEHWDYFNEVLSLLEAALSLERAHDNAALAMIEHSADAWGHTPRQEKIQDSRRGSPRQNEAQSDAHHECVLKDITRVHDISPHVGRNICPNGVELDDEEELVEGNVRCVHYDALGTAENGHQDTPTTPPARGYDRGH
ncbi:armadillo-type protein [Suillus subluteus]|nr:armadillo-type protein [Suillus subluteus]